jgi:hypothetical protein
MRLQKRSNLSLSFNFSGNEAPVTLLSAAFAGKMPAFPTYPKLTLI